MLIKKEKDSFANVIKYYTFAERTKEAYGRRKCTL